MEFPKVIKTYPKPYTQFSEISFLISKVFLVFLILVSKLIISTDCFGQNSISGEVKDIKSKYPLSGTTVELHETEQTTLTNDSGEFEFKNIKPGVYHLHFRHLGYEPATQSVQGTDSVKNLLIYMHKGNFEFREFVIEADPFRNIHEESTVPVYGLNENDLKGGANDFSESISEIPGIRSANVSSGMGKPVIRGMSGNGIQININGIKQEGQQWGSDHGIELLGTDVENVEVIKGPMAFMYGSDAIGGVINVRTVEVPEENRVSADFGTGYNSALHAGTIAARTEINYKGFFAKAKYGFRSSGDISVPTNAEIENLDSLDFNLSRIPNTASLFESQNYLIGVKRKWGVSSINYSRFQQLSGFYIPELLQNELDNPDNGNIDLPNQETLHERIVSNNHVAMKEGWIEANFGYQNNVRKEFESEFGHVDTSETEPSLNLNLTTYTFNTHLHQNLNNNQVFIFGMSGYLSSNDQSGEEFLIPAFTSTNTGFFAFLQSKPTEKVDVNFGIRTDMGRISAPITLAENEDDPAIIDTLNHKVDKSFNVFTGATGIVYHPTHHFNLKANFGSTFRMPTINELSSNGVHHGAVRFEKGNTTLEPVHGLQTDVGMEFHEDKFLVRITPYYNYYLNYIFLSPTGNLVSGLPEYSYENGKSYITGTEFVADYHPNSSLHFLLEADVLEGVNLETKEYLPFIPAWMLRAEGKYKMEKLWNSWVSINYIYTFEKTRVDPNESTTNSYGLIDVALGSDIFPEKFNGKLKFGVRNLFNERYFNHISAFKTQGIPQTGRSFYFGLTLPFGFNLKLPPVEPLDETPK